MPEPSIIYEDVDILALDKPAGLEVVAVGEWLKAKYPQYPAVRLAHRLDKDTTGVLLVAKDQASYEYLKNLFQTHQIKKKYLALVYGLMKNDSGLVALPIGRSRKDPRKRIAGRGATGKLREAVTEYRVLEKFGDYSLIEVRPRTGRTHQIRVHLKALGYPIVADQLYAPASRLAGEPLMSRQALHAASVELIAPTGQALKLESPLPPDFTAALANLRRSC